MMTMMMMMARMTVVVSVTFPAMRWPHIDVERYFRTSATVTTKMLTLETVFQVAAMKAGSVRHACLPEDVRMGMLVIDIVFRAW